MAKNWLVVVTTRFWPRDFVIVATTGPLTPLSKKALLNAFLRANGEKSLAVVLTSTSRFCLGLGKNLALVFGLTKVHSNGSELEHELVIGLELEHELAPGPLEPRLALEAYEPILGGLGGLGGPGGPGGRFSRGVVVLAIAKALVFVSICRETVSKLAIYEAIINKAACSRPFSMYSLKTLIRSRSFACLSRELV